MTSSILKNTRKMLGLPDDDTSFNEDLITHINSALGALRQLGVGPKGKDFFIVDDSATWEDFLQQDDNYKMAALYVYYKVKLGFDPPATSFTQEAIKNQISELEWRLNLEAEEGAMYEESPTTSS